RLAALLPGTMTAPEFPPSIAAARLSRRRPERCLVGPWQDRQWAGKIGLMSRWKSTRAWAAAVETDRNTPRMASVCEVRRRMAGSVVGGMEVKRLIDCT